ncbi:MAG TPA: hypothetical protein PLM07_07680 [Candidatus Rifleibacterium sp.]|nr:hypothetical protein [Candidatus Rifleibacterium sp.]HPT45765.1 hypothetical protein [Candidatus Rifleibacterium sp.]
MTSTSASRNLGLSVILTLSIILIAWFLGSMKSSPLIPATTLIIADYQMESAIIMQMQQLNSNPNQKPKPLKKEILPGIFLELQSSPKDEKSWIFKASVNGLGISRSMQAVADSDNPDRILFIR